MTNFYSDGLGLAIAEALHIIGMRCGCSGSVVDRLSVFGVGYADVSFFCYHRRVLCTSRGTSASGEIQR